jgi:tetratricopeptide (TPR) repeat protein
MISHLTCKREYAKAEQLYLQALQIKQQECAPDHIELATVYNNLGNLSIAIYKKLLDIDYKAYGVDCMDQAPLSVHLFNFGMIYYKRGDFFEAKIHMLRSHEISCNVYGLNHVKTKAIHSWLNKLN